MRLLHLLAPSILTTTALAGPWYRRAEPTSTSTASFPPAPTGAPGVAGQYCPSFGYSTRCSVDAECPSYQKCVSGSYLNGTDTANCAGQCYSPTVAPTDLPVCPYVDGKQSCRGSNECGFYSVCTRTGPINADRDACSGTCGQPYLGGCPRPNGSGGTICGSDNECAADERCQYATRTGDGCSGYCTKRDVESQSSSDSSITVSSSDSSMPTSTSSTSSAPSTSSTVAPAGQYCGSFGFDQICSTTEECSTGYDCVPKEQNGTTTAGCTGLCRYAGVSINLPSCPSDFDGRPTCRNSGNCGPYGVCNKSGPINADRSACNGLCGTPYFGPCPRNNTDGSRNCDRDSQCGETQRCGPGTRGVTCSGTCISLPTCKKDADCKPDEYTDYGVCAPNGFCYQFSDCRSSRDSCPGGICGNNSPNATNYQEGYTNRTIPFICIFNATSSSSSMSLSATSKSTASSEHSSSGTVKPTGEVKPEPTSMETHPTSGTSDKTPAPTSKGDAHPAPAASDKTPSPTSDGGSHPAPVASADTAKPTPEASKAAPAPTPSHDVEPASSSAASKAEPATDKEKPAPTPSEHSVKPSADGTKPAPAPAASSTGHALPRPIVPVMCMGLEDIAKMLKEIKEDIAQIKVDIKAIKGKVDKDEL